MDWNEAREKVKKVGRSAAVGGAVAGPAGAAIGVVDALTGEKIGKTLTKAADRAFGGELAGKAGLGKYKPGEINIEEDFLKGRQQARERVMDQHIRNRIADVEGRSAFSADPTTINTVSGMKAADYTSPTDFRNKQQVLSGQLAQQAAGRGPSLATQMLQDARDQQIAQAMALGASQRGLTAGQGLRGIQDQTQQAAQFAAREAAKARIAEQLAARQQLAGVAGEARGQDIGEEQFQTGVQQQANLENMKKDLQVAMQQGLMDQRTAEANLQAEITNQAQQDEFLRMLEKERLAMEKGGFGQELDIEKLKAEIALRQQGIEAGAYKDWAGRTGDFLGNIGQAAAAAGAAGAPSGSATAAGMGSLAGSAAT